MSLVKFQKRTKGWFIARVGQIVEKEFSMFTPTSVRKASLTKQIMICSEKHALGCYAYHIDNKVNFSEPVKETSRPANIGINTLNRSLYETKSKSAKKDPS